MHVVGMLAAPLFLAIAALLPIRRIIFGASDGDIQFVVDAGTRACYKQPGPDDTETARTTLDSRGSGGAAYPFITRAKT